MGVKSNNHYFLEGHRNRKRKWYQIPIRMAGQTSRCSFRSSFLRPLTSHACGGIVCALHLQLLEGVGVE